MNHAIEVIDWLNPALQWFTIVSVSEQGSFLDELDRFGSQAAIKLIRRAGKYGCPKSQSNKKAWVVDHIQHKWDARFLSRSTSLAVAQAKAVRL